MARVTRAPARVCTCMHVHVCACACERRTSTPPTADLLSSPLLPARCCDEGEDTHAPLPAAAWLTAVRTFRGLGPLPRRLHCRRPGGSSGNLGLEENEKQFTAASHAHPGQLRCSRRAPGRPGRRSRTRTLRGEVVPTGASEPPDPRAS